MNIFKQSTQYKNWIMPKEKLDAEELKKFDIALKKIIDINRSLEGTDNKQKVTIKVNKVLKPHEEKELILFYTNQILKIITRKTPSRSLKTYALSFFRRFYFKRTVVDYDPEYLLCATIFLGAKVAQLNVNLDKMKILCPFLEEKHPIKKIDNLLLLIEYEFYLINVLNYEFFIFCPYKAMMGFMSDLKVSDVEIFDEKNVTAEQFEEKCESLIDQTFLTDLLFLVSYSYIALSCIFIAGEFFGIEMRKIKEGLNLDAYFNFDDYLNTKYSMVKEYIAAVKVISDEEFIEHKKKVIKFLSKNPRYIERIEKDRAGLQAKMMEFSEIFETNLAIPQQKSTSDATIKNEMVPHKREREDTKTEK